MTEGPVSCGTPSHGVLLQLQVLSIVGPGAVGACYLLVHGEPMWHCRRHDCVDHASDPITLLPEIGKFPFPVNLRYLY